MTPPPKIWVVFEATRETLAALIGAIDAVDLSLGDFLDHEECDTLRHAIRAALERKEQPWVGWETKPMDNGSVVSRYRYKDSRRVLVVPMGEGE